MLKAGLGLIVLAGIAFVTPASAQSVYVGDRGVAVKIGGDRDHHRSRHYRSHRGHDSYAACKTTRIERPNGSVKIVRSCR